MSVIRVSIGNGPESGQQKNIKLFYCIVAARRAGDIRAGSKFSTYLYSLENRWQWSHHYDSVSYSIVTQKGQRFSRREN